jgi:hypothetical protein
MWRYRGKQVSIWPEYKYDDINIGTKVNEYQIYSIQNHHLQTSRRCLPLDRKQTERAHPAIWTRIEKWKDQNRENQGK